MHYEYNDEETHYGCLKCSREEIYRDGLCRRHYNIEKILADLVGE